MNKLFILTIICAYTISMNAMENKPSEPIIHPLFAKYKKAVEIGDYETFSPDELNLKAEIQTHNELSQLTDTERVKLKSIAEQQYEESQFIAQKKVMAALENKKMPEDYSEWFIIEKSRLTLKMLTLFLTKAYWCRLHMKIDRLEQYTTEESEKEKKQAKIKQKEKKLNEIFSEYRHKLTFGLTYEALSPNDRNPEYESTTRAELEQLTPSQRTKLLQRISALYESNMMKRKIYAAYGREFCEKEISQDFKLRMDLFKAMMPTTEVLYNSK